VLAGVVAGHALPHSRHRALGVRELRRRVHFKVLCQVEFAATAAADLARRAGQTVGYQMGAQAANVVLRAEADGLVGGAGLVGACFFHENDFIAAEWSGYLDFVGRCGRR